MKRLFLAVITVAALSVLGPVAAAADTVTLATVDCADGSPFSVPVDLGTLTKLQASVQGIIDNPAGLSCGLSTSAPLDPGAGSGTQAFVTGGGRYVNSANCMVSFGLSAHMDADGAHGTSNFTENASPTCPQGHVTSTVTCLNVSGSIGDMGGNITQVDGVYAAMGYAVGDIILTDVQDNGPPGSVQPDNIVHYTFFNSSGNATCDTNTIGIFQVVHGNITVRDR